jgi:hypothetical protein
MKDRSMKRARSTEKPRKLVVHLKRKQRTQPVNPNHWSESSKRSGIFQTPPSHYEDIAYRCARCGEPAVFTAADQKLAFEGRKAYIWQRRVLCPECWGERQRIEHGIRECQTRWRDRKSELQRDREFLRHWLGLLERHPEYGGRKNHAGINMLRRLVAQSAS